MHFFCTCDDPSHGSNLKSFRCIFSHFSIDVERWSDFNFFENSIFYFLIFLHFKLFVFELFFQFRFFRKFGLISFFPIILYEFNFFLNSCLISFSLDKISNFRTKINILICAKKSFFLSFDILLISWQNRSKMSNGVRHFTHSTFYSFYDKIVVKCRMAFDIFLIRHFTHVPNFYCNITLYCNAFLWF